MMRSGWDESDEQLHYLNRYQGTACRRTKEKIF
jgi:hypothetical protein